MRQAQERDAGVICIGDWFDAMGGRNDKRAVKSTARKDDVVDNYFDSLVDHSVDYLRPYASNLVMFGDGNHETAILRHNETDLLERMTRELGCLHTGYSGFIRCLFDANKKCSRRIYYHHGSGGGGPVTKGVIATNRRAASVDADIYLSGHIHEAWALENMVVSVSNKGEVVFNTQLHVQLPTYKQEYETGGYHIERGRPAKPLGGYWLTFYHDMDAPGRIAHKVERAN